MGSYKPADGYKTLAENKNEKMSMTDDERKKLGEKMENNMHGWALYLDALRNVDIIRRLESPRMRTKSVGFRAEMSDALPKAMGFSSNLFNTMTLRAQLEDD